jgi:hypothetical protein
LSRPNLSSVRSSKHQTRNKALPLKILDFQFLISNHGAHRLNGYSVKFGVWSLKFLSLVLGCWILALSSTGCVSKSKAQADARAAFMAGQQQGMIARTPQPAHNAVTLVGPVRTPSLTWTQDLTLAKAIVDAGYESAVDPTQIMIVRNGQAIPVDPQSLLAGQDVPLLPGDMIVLQQ